MMMIIYICPDEAVFFLSFFKLLPWDPFPIAALQLTVNSNIVTSPISVSSLFTSGFSLLEGAGKS